MGSLAGVTVLQQTQPARCWAIQGSLSLCKGRGHTCSPKTASHSNAGASPHALPSWRRGDSHVGVIPKAQLPLSMYFFSPGARELLAGSGSLLGLGKAGKMLLCWYSSHPLAYKPTQWLHTSISQSHGSAPTLQDFQENLSRVWQPSSGDLSSVPLVSLGRAGRHRPCPSALRISVEAVFWHMRL